MSIGAALADARWQAHLTVADVSHRTRIREAIIWGIEQDDFSACGGDAYARGHIRAIAQAVGTDPDPLIAQYDQTYRTNEDIDDVVALKPPPPPGRPPKPHRRGVLAASATLSLIVLAVVAWAIYHVASGVGQPRHSQAAAASSRSSSSPGSGVAADGQGSRQPSATPTTPSPVPTTPSPTPTPTHSTPPPAPASQALSISGAEPFGPGGVGTGDNPQTAHLAIDSLYATGWHSDWYTTAALGNLKPGTGLLLDLGRRVTINDAQLELGGFSGAAIQLKAGNAASPGDLHEVARVSNAGTSVTLNFKTPARAKYLLIWFTQLAPDGTGTYQAAVYHVIVRGHS